MTTPQTIDLTARRTSGDNGDFVILPTDVYRMKIMKAVIEENRFGEPQPDGTKPFQITLTWEVTALTDEQREAAEDAGEDWDSATVPQYLNPYYGPVRRGGVSKFQEFIDGLREQGLLDDFDLSAFNPAILVGIEQRISVQKYIKSQGDNAGKPGNKVTAVLPLRAKKTKKASEAVEADVL